MAPSTPPSAAFDLDALESRLATGDDPYLPFLDTRVLRSGLYRLPAGGTDDQPIHDDDEIYYVIRGRATLSAGDASHPARPGATLFVRAGVEHRFVDIEEDLEVLVVFGATPGEEAPGGAVP
jgi:quercetin dioxygenase-like cupin family protein